MNQKNEINPNIERYAISYGNCFDGITLYGPFESFEDAQVYINESNHPEQYNIVSLNQPE